MNVLERNKSSCFNENHLTTEIKSAGTGHSLKCSDLSVYENDSITWYKVITETVSLQSLAVETNDCREILIANKFLEVSTIIVKP